MESCAKALARLVSWSNDPKQRLLVFLRLFKYSIVLQGGRYVAKDSQKRVQLPPEAETYFSFDFQMCQCDTNLLITDIGIEMPNMLSRNSFPNKSLGNSVYSLVVTVPE